MFWARLLFSPKWMCFKYLQRADQMSELILDPLNVAEWWFNKKKKVPKNEWNLIYRSLVFPVATQSSWSQRRVLNAYWLMHWELCLQAPLSLHSNDPGETRHDGCYTTIHPSWDRMWIMNCYLFIHSRWITFKVSTEINLQLKWWHFTQLNAYIRMIGIKLKYSIGIRITVRVLVLVLVS